MGFINTPRVISVSKMADCSFIYAGPLINGKLLIFNRPLTIIILDGLETG